MFSLKEQKSIDFNYFVIFETGPYWITLKSKNTRHFWKVQDTGQGCIIFHSHQGDGNYHFQCKRSSLKQSIETIQAHDTFQLTRRRPENNDYDYIPLLPDSEYFVF